MTQTSIYAKSSGQNFPSS